MVEKYGSKFSESGNFYDIYSGLCYFLLLDSGLEKIAFHKSS